MEEENAERGDTGALLVRTNSRPLRGTTHPRVPPRVPSRSPYLVVVRLGFPDEEPRGREDLVVHRRSAGPALRSAAHTSCKGEDGHGDMERAKGEKA